MKTSPSGHGCCASTPRPHCLRGASVRVHRLLAAVQLRLVSVPRPRFAIIALAIIVLAIIALAIIALAIIALAIIALAVIALAIIAIAGGNDSTSLLPNLIQEIATNRQIFYTCKLDV